VRLLVRVGSMGSMERKKHRHDSMLFRGLARWNPPRSQTLASPVLFECASRGRGDAERL